MDMGSTLIEELFENEREFNLLSFRKSHLVGKILYNTSYYVNDSCHRIVKHTGKLIPMYE